MAMDNSYQWVPFYEALADKLLEYKDKREELFNLMKKLASEQQLMKYLHFDREDWWELRQYQIDPFSVMAVMNRDITKANKTLLANVLADAFNITVTVPTEFKGIPTLNNQKSFFAGVDEVWNLFIQAMKATEVNQLSIEFKEAFEKAIAVNGNGLASITTGLFLIRPSIFMPLDKNSRSYVSSQYDIAVPSGAVISGEEYVEFLSKLKSKLEMQSPGTSFQEVSHTAWVERGTNRQLDTDIQMPDNVISDKNIILYGTPGTGKTYSSIQYAVAIVEEKSIFKIQAEEYDDVFSRYLKYKNDGLIAFTTFHQSFGYEEFIEGIRPVVFPEENTESTREIEYEVHNGVFKAFCDKAGTPVASGKNVDFGIGKSPTVWKVSLEGTGDNPTRTECLKNGHIRIGWDNYGESVTDSIESGSNVLNAFYNKMQIGDIIMSCYSSKTIDAVGVVTGDPEWHNEYSTYKRLRKVNWLVKNINEDIVDLNSGKNMTLSTVYKLSVTVSDVLQILRKLRPVLFNQEVKIPNRVFIIDEINRGNISKIFGELITLIEPSKRLNAKEQLRATLPYSGKNFGVPDNVYIIGTMNTADRSIAMIDTALRRRFSFIEMQPESATLKDVLIDGVDTAKMLDTLNKRITILLDREHTIGHSYLLPLKNNPTIENLAEIFKNKIVPLLQEFFYDDYEKIQLVLGDNQKADDNTRFIVKRNDAVKLFGNADINFPEYYEVNSEAFLEIDAYEFLQ